VALLLRRRGIARVRPLQGGLAAWKARGYPVHDTRGAGAAAPVGVTLE
jgi:3-mercaptopyruvate sulfurtransferase SseA